MWFVVYIFVYLFLAVSALWPTEKVQEAPITLLPSSLFGSRLNWSSGVLFNFFYFV